jgi:NitT/TauT family transport system substrate-binding protein
MQRKAALTVLGGALAGALPRPAGAQNSRPGIRIAGSLTDPYMGPYYSREQGIYEKAGLNVEVITQPTVAAALNAVAANAADCAQADLIQISNGRVRGIDFTIFAGGGIYRSTNRPQLALAVLRDAAIHTARDLEGSSVGVVTLNSLSQIATEEWIRKSGGDPSKVRFIELSFPAMPAALSRNLVQAAVAVEPFLSSGSIPLRILENIYNDIAPFYLGCWVTTHAWLKQNPDAARRLVAVIYETARWANAHQDDTAAIIAKYTKFTVEDIEKETRVPYATTLDPALMTPILQDAYRYGAIPKPVTAAELITRV